MSDSSHAPLSGQHSHGVDQVQGPPAPLAAEGALDLDDTAANDPSEGGAGEERYQLDAAIRVTKLRTKKPRPGKPLRGPAARLWIAIGLEVGKDAQGMLSGFLESLEATLGPQLLRVCDERVPAGVCLDMRVSADARTSPAPTPRRN